MAFVATKSRLFRARLCQLLTGADISGPEQQDGALWYGARREGVDRLLMQRLARSSSPDVSQQTEQAMAAAFRQYRGDHLRLRHAAARALAALRDADIPVLCMRGVAVGERYYGEDACLRPAGDIDLLLDKQQMLAAKQALWDIGFRPDSVYRNIYQRGDMTIDLHHEPIGIERIRAWQYLTPLRAEDLFRNSEEGELAGERALLLHPRVNLPYLCFHALKHSFERLIWLYDIALLANDVDRSGQWDEVLDGIREYRLERPCFYALAYARTHLGAQVPETLLAAIRPAMGFVERRLFRRHMNHETIPFLAERLFARMQPDFSHRIEFWHETIYPRYEIRAQMVGAGCVKCNFIRKRLKQLVRASWAFVKEGFLLLRA